MQRHRVGAGVQLRQYHRRHAIRPGSAKPGGANQGLVGILAIRIEEVLADQLPGEFAHALGDAVIHRQSASVASSARNAGIPSPVSLLVANTDGKAAAWARVRASVSPSLRAR